MYGGNSVNEDGRSRTNGGLKKRWGDKVLQNRHSKQVRLFVNHGEFHPLSAFVQIPQYTSENIFCDWYDV